MSTINEIEDAIRQLPLSQIEELIVRLEIFRQRQAPSPAVENWLKGARGAACPGETTAKIMALTRADD